MLSGQAQTYHCGNWGDPSSDDFCIKMRTSDHFAPASASASDTHLTETFFTSFGEMLNAESMDTTSLLADKAFKHRITSTDNTAAPTPAILGPYNFNTTTDIQYDDTKFKGLLIDSGAATRSTGGVGQLRALQQKTTAGSSNFVFGIGSAQSIGKIKLDTPIGMIVFHIIQVNPPFLLCLADMDRLGAFFNNITNKLL